MSLLVPDTGLLFWMILSFGLVFFILAKFGFPIIVNMVEKRRDYIEKSLLGAKEATNKMNNLRSEGERMMAEARGQQLELLQDANSMRDRIIKDAKNQAENEALKVMEAARLTIGKEKEDAMKEVRSQVAELSVNIAEKIIRKNLGDTNEQTILAEKLLNEANN